jgi:hypothetical protein
MPTIGREPPVPDIDDTPRGDSAQVDDEVDAVAVRAVDCATAEDHLPAVGAHAPLTRGEAERLQDRVELFRDQVEGEPPDAASGRPAG